MNQTVMIPISEVHPYPNNPRVNKDAVDKVAASLKEFGFKQPIVVDKNMVVIVGHTRLKAAKKLKMKEVPVLIADDLSEEQVKAYRLADNKTAEFSEWDNDLLNIELDSILDLDMEQFGFSALDEDKEKAEKPEVEFSEILGEENNYLVLQFKTDVDWLNAQSVFGLETVKSYSTRQDGKVTKNMEMRGIPRIIDGAKALNKLTGGVL